MTPPGANADRPGPGPGRLIVVSGPSGVGKSTIVRRALAQTGADFSVSATTRPPRPGEADGREYRFVGRDEFERMIAADELLEWAEVFGDCYGTPAAPVRRALDAGRAVVLEIDVQGGTQVHRKMPGASFVLIAPPGGGELRRRLSGRGTEGPEVLERRLAQANEELRAAAESGLYTETVVNDDLERAVRQVVGIIAGQREKK